MLTEEDERLSVTQDPIMAVLYKATQHGQHNVFTHLLVQSCIVGLC